MQELRPDQDIYAWGQCAPVGIAVTWGGSDASHTRWCYPQYIYWNTWSVAASEVNSTIRYNYIGCHEVGHTVGLRHRTAVTCMWPSPAPPSAPGNPLPTLHGYMSPTFTEIQHVNSHY